MASTWVPHYDARKRKTPPWVLDYQEEHCAANKDSKLEAFLMRSNPKSYHAERVVVKVVYCKD